MLTEDFILSALTTIKTRYMHLYIHHSTVTIPKAWKQPKCLSTDEWIKKIWYIYTMKYYLAIKGQNNAIYSNMDGTRDSHNE